MEASNVVDNNYVMSAERGSATSSSDTAATPRYSDTQSLGCIAPISIVLGAVIVGAYTGFSIGVTACVHGLQPIHQICECPQNAATFDETANFYASCVKNTSKDFQIFNAVPQNETIEVQGWFYSATFTRETLRGEQLETTLVLEDGKPAPYLYRCPLYRPFWWYPFDWLSLCFVLSFFLATISKVARSRIVKNEILADRVEVTYFGGRREAVPLYAINGEVKKHEMSSLPPVRSCALSLKATEFLCYDAGSTSGGITSTILKGGKTRDFRTEPADVEAFQAALKAARAAMPARRHFLVDEIPSSVLAEYPNRLRKSEPSGAAPMEPPLQHSTAAVLPATSTGAHDAENGIPKEGRDEGKIQVEWKGKHTIGYWFRSILIVLTSIAWHLGMNGTCIFSKRHSTLVVPEWRMSFQAPHRGRR